jgi:hypothetical protein
MARPVHPRRGTDLRPVPPKPVAPVIDTALFSELRHLISGLAERVGDPRAESRALARSLATQAEKLNDLAALQNDTARQLAEVERRRSEGPLARLVGVARVRLASGRERLGMLLPLRPAEARAASDAGAGQPPIPWILGDSAVYSTARSVMALVCGLSPDDQRAIAARLLCGRLPSGVVPVFVTDATDFEQFRAHRAFFEHLPLRPHRLSSVVRDHELYAARRFALLCDKWKPIRVVAFGPTAAHHLGLWRRSPHVAPQIRELIQAAETE